MGLFNDFEVPDSEYYQAARELIPLSLVLPSSAGLWTLVSSGFDSCACRLPGSISRGRAVRRARALDYSHLQLRPLPSRNDVRFDSLRRVGSLWLVRAWRSREVIPRRNVATIFAVVLTAAAWLPSPSVSSDAANRNRKASPGPQVLVADAGGSQQLAKQIESGTTPHFGSSLAKLISRSGSFDLKRIADFPEAVRIDGSNSRALARLGCVAGHGANTERRSPSWNRFTHRIRRSGFLEQIAGDVRESRGGSCRPATGCGSQRRLGNAGRSLRAADRFQPACARGESRIVLAAHAGLIIKKRAAQLRTENESVRSGPAAWIESAWRVRTISTGRVAVRCRRSCQLRPPNDSFTIRAAHNAAATLQFTFSTTHPQ